MQTHPLDRLGHIYVINLKSRADRRRDMQREFSAIGFRPERAHWFDAICPNSAGPFESKGARGCFMSHLAILGDAVENRWKRILILEDDVAFEPNFVARLEALLSGLDRQPWDMFYGGGRVERRKACGPQLASVEPETPIVCAHFVSIDGPAIGRVKDYVEAQLTRPEGDSAGGPMPIDGSYSWARRELGLKTFIADPDLCRQRSSRSDISPGWQDRIWGVREAVSLVRRMRSH